MSTRSRPERTTASLRRTSRSEDAALDADRRLALQAFAHLERLERRAKLELVVEVGDYLIETFFDGDLELAQSHNPTKPDALRMLEEMVPQIELSASQMSRAVATSVQYRALPEAVRDRLTVRQHRALLPLADPREKSKLARRAVSEGIPGPRLAEIVRAEHGRARTGRKPKGELERTLDAARRLLVSARLEAAVDASKLRELEPELRARLAHDCRTLRERIERISDALTRVTR